MHGAWNDHLLHWNCYVHPVLNTYTSALKGCAKVLWIRNVRCSEASPVSHMNLPDSIIRYDRMLLQIGTDGPVNPADPTAITQQHVGMTVSSATSSFQALHLLTW